MMTLLAAGCSQLNRVADDLNFDFKKPAVYTLDGAPAESADVSIVPVDNLPAEGGSAYSTTTDANGQYDVPPMDDGLYNIIVRKDSLIAVQNSVYLGREGGARIRDITLMGGVNYVGYVKMQPNHDPRSVIVQVIGWDMFDNNVGEDGYFTFRNMPPSGGRPYRMLLTSTEEGYTPTYADFFVRVYEWDGTVDTIEMIYTGIPVISGLTIWYDSASGVINASWDPSTCRNFFDYAVYYDSWYQSSPFASDWRSPIYQANPSFTFQIDGGYDWAGFDYYVGTYEEDLAAWASPQKFAMTVAIRTVSLELGPKCRPAEVSYHPAGYYQPHLGYHIENYTKGETYDQYWYQYISTGDSLGFTVWAHDHGRSIVSMSLQDLSFDGRIQTKYGDDDCHSLSVTLKTRALEGDSYKNISCTVVDDAGESWSDTLWTWIFQPYDYGDTLYY